MKKSITINFDLNNIQDKIAYEKIKRLSYQNDKGKSYIVKQEFLKYFIRGE